MFIPGWANGRDAAIDVSVVSPVQITLVRKAAEEAGSAAQRRYKEKNDKFFTLCDKEGIQFLPAVDGDLDH